MGNLSKHFSRHEFACSCGCGFDTVDVELLSVLEDLSNKYNEAPIAINSGCRCINHNHSVGGSPKSKHLRGIATDIVVKGISSDDVYTYLNKVYPDKYGIGKYVGRTHIDIRQDKTRWDRT